MSLQPHNTFTQARPHTGLVRLQGLWQLCLDLIFPPRCAGCGRVDHIWCARCQHELENVPIKAYLRADVVSVPLVAATGLHSDILREAVQGLKYGNVQVLAAALGARLARRLQMQNWTIDMLIPVPLHAARLRERGYNQAQMVCEAAARQLALPCVPEALRRERYTHSQVGLTRAERMRNVVDAFSADPDRVSQRTIVVVDDVCTTGSTLSACAQALLAAGARMVYGLTVTVARDTNIVSHYTQGVGHGDQNSRS